MEFIRNKKKKPEGPSSNQFGLLLLLLGKRFMKTCIDAR